MKPVIVVQHVTKKYSRNANAHLSYGISDLYREITGRNRSLKLRADEFYAVDQVSFYVNQGESIALIGRNGSGKTTLLKMMNGLTKVDDGVITMEGRVQALINLGAGFNPSLSGHDNILNSAALMGFNATQSRAVLEEVIEFSELEEFIDSPIGTYSSGMQARLGFSVAINLQPDILLIDEILAVGDYAFRNKCFIRMHELKKQGVTIVLVTHSPTDVIQLCERAVWLNHGAIERIGPAKDVMQEYLDFLGDEEKQKSKKLQALKKENAKKIEENVASGSGESIYGPIHDELDNVEDLYVRFLVDGEETESLRVHDELVIEYGFRLKKEVTDLNLTLCVFNKAGVKFNALSTLNGDLLKSVHNGEVRCRVRILDFNLNPGTYVMVMPIHEGKSYLYRNVVKEFVVTGLNRMTWEMVDFRYEYNVELPEAHKKTALFL